jgi:hypothetical protein
MQGSSWGLLGRQWRPLGRQLRSASKVMAVSALEVV